MARKSNKATDVFRYINMHNGDTDVCWEWTGALGGRDNRPYFSCEGQKWLGYRLVYTLYHGPLEKGQVVRHKCDNKLCCNPHHLESGTHQDNMNDMKERERHGLPHHTVKAIKRILASKAEGVTDETHAEIAERFGVSRQTIGAINEGRVYQHVKVETHDDE